MKYLGWVISVILVLVGYFIYKTQYLPLKKDVIELEQEIKMWEDILKGKKGIVGERYSFPTERFFSDDKLTPYGEVEILRKFDIHYNGIEIYISAPQAYKRAHSVLKFLTEQRIEYPNLSLYVVFDSLEKFEYKFIK